MEELQGKMTESEASYARKDQEKEEMIRQMKQKLEESPENISVTVKQQDAIIKKGGARPEPASSGGTEELAQVSRQLESLTKVNQELSAGHQNLAAENAALSQQTEAGGSAGGTAEAAPEGRMLSQMLSQIYNQLIMKYQENS